MSTYIVCVLYTSTWDVCNWSEPVDRATLTLRIRAGFPSSSSGPVLETGQNHCTGPGDLSTGISCGSEATEATCEPSAPLRDNSYVKKEFALLLLQRVR